MFELPPVNAIYAMAGLYALLAFGTAIIFALPFFNPKKNYRELKLRITTWWMIILFFSLTVFGSRVVSIICFALLSYFTLKEYFSLVKVTEVDRRVRLWAYISIVGQYYLVLVDWYTFFIVFIPVYLFMFLPLRMIIVGDTKNYLHRISTYQWGLLLSVFSIGHIAYLFNLGREHNPIGHGAGLVIFICALTELNDVAQFCWGKALGKKKIVPTVSPNKTWVGFLGGAVTTAFLSWLVAPFLTPLTPGHSIVMGFLIALGGFIGDVNISAVKRDLGVKDSGKTLPGHGGILDRVDSLTYTGFIFFHYTRYFFG